MKSVPVVSFAVLLAAACSGQVAPRGPGESPPDRGGGGSGGVTGKTTTPPTCAEGLPPARLWRLTHAQLRNSLLDVFGFVPAAAGSLPEDARLDGFANDADALAVTSLLTEYYYKAADEVAADLVRRSGDFLTCPLDQLGAGSCLQEFLERLTTRAWRRPSTPDEVARLRKVYTTAAGATDPATGLRMVVQALVLSPHFLFRTELGAPGATGAVTSLTDHEMASALSYALWDAPPDPPLLALAAAGKLRDRATLVAQARRMLGAKQAPAALDAFVQQWLKVDDLASIQKDTALYPAYSAQVGADLLEENRLFINSVVFDVGGDRTLRTLLTSSAGYVNARTAKLYGASATGNDLARTQLDASQRKGLLTQGAFMAAHADADSTRLVDRGRFIREEVLCLEVPKPPAQFMFTDPKITEDMTAREKLQVHAENPACAVCHKLFDAIGFAMENYDPVGQFRTTEKGKKIDPSGTTPLPDDRELKFNNFVDLVGQMADLPEPYACFATRYLQYATGRHEVAQCERMELAKLFQESGHRVDALVLAVVGSPGFSIRKN